MSVFKDIKLVRIIAGLLLFLGLFSYYLTNLEEQRLNNRYRNARFLTARDASRRIGSVPRETAGFSSVLSELLLDDYVAYALLQKSDGSLLGKSFSETVNFEAVDELAEEALNTFYVSFLSYHSRLYSIEEVVVPLNILPEQMVFLRLGFFKEEQLSRVWHLKFRNLLFYIFISFALIAYVLVKKSNIYNLRFLLTVGMIVILSFAFFSIAFIFRTWQLKQQKIVFTDNSLSLSKLVAFNAVDYLSEGRLEGLEKSVGFLSSVTGFVNLSVFKGNKIVYHSNASAIEKAQQRYEDKSERFDVGSPVIINADDEYTYEVLVPLVVDHKRLGTLIVVFRKSEFFTITRTLSAAYYMVFIICLLLSVILAHFISHRFSKEVRWFLKAMERVTAGDFTQQIHIERNDEFGDMAHAFNFMLMSFKERDRVGRGLQHYVSRSVVEKSLRSVAVSDKNGEKVFVVSCFVYLSGLSDSIESLDGERILNSVQCCYENVRKVAQPSTGKQLKILPEGFLMLFSSHNRHDSLIEAMNAANMLVGEFKARTDLVFSPRVTLHATEMLKGQPGNSHEDFFGDITGDYKAASKIQDTDEIVVSREVYSLLKDALDFEELEVLSKEQGRITVFAYKNFKSIDELVLSFGGATSWTKILILRILKAGYELTDPEPLFEWYKDDQSETRYQVMEVLEQFTHLDSVCEFVADTVESEKDPRVLSRAIKVLGKIGDEKHIAVLSEKLRASDSRVKASAVEALEAIGGKRVYEFLNLLVDEKDNRVKANILIALGKHGDLKVFDLLSQMIIDPSPNMRASAAYALGKLGMAQGVEPLIHAMTDTDPMVRRQVIASLTKLKAELEVDFD